MAPIDRNKRVDELAELIWEYHLLHHQLEKADCIFALGCHDAGVAIVAADLFLAGWADLLLISGGVLFDKDAGEMTEAEYFRDIALQKGVPADKILIENKATNTGENFQLGGELLKQKGLDFTKFILVQKPYMERRTYATGMLQWKGKELILASEKISFKEYLKKGILRDRILNTMLGDLQRIKLYPEKGFQVHQEIPPEVWAAFEELVSYGFDKRLIKE
ncbi:MAG: YdcF family protein [Bacteroidota bacterium]